MNREERENDVLEQLLRESLASDAEPAEDFTARLMEQVHRTPQDKARKQPYQKILAALAACAVIAVAIPLIMPRMGSQNAVSADSAAPEMQEEANGADTADDRLVYSTAPTNGGEEDFDTAGQQDRKQNFGAGEAVTLTGQEAGEAREVLDAMAVEPVSAGDGSVTYDLTREQAAALGETVEALHDIDGGVTLILEVVE